MQTKTSSKIKNNLYRSVPLVPVFGSLFVFIALLSPFTWTSGRLSLFIMADAVGLGIVCAYCTTIFIEEYVVKK